VRRLFAALDPPADVVADLDRVLPRKGTALRWVPPDQWHLTTAFFGDVSAVDEEDLQARLARAAGRTTPISLQLKSAGASRAGRTVLGCCGRESPATSPSWQGWLTAVSRRAVGAGSRWNGGSSRAT
jgi:RNA 2',3'-cyclic 3'-phosphodiesterase